MAVRGTRSYAPSGLFQPTILTLIQLVLLPRVLQKQQCRSLKVECKENTHTQQQADAKTSDQREAEVHKVTLKTMDGIRLSLARGQFRIGTTGSRSLGHEDVLVGQLGTYVPRYLPRWEEIRWPLRCFSIWRFHCIYGLILPHKQRSPRVPTG